MEGYDVKVNSSKAWLLAARPKTLAASGTPVLIGLASAYSDLGARLFCVLPAVLCLLYAVIMQIAANFTNDYFDFVRGNDANGRLGPERACAMGWVTPSAMRRAIVIALAAACLVGMPLVLYGGIEMVIIGVLCIVSCILYTTRLSYIGMGDILVVVFFGVVPVTIVYYLQAHAVTFRVVMLSVACGLAIDTLLMVNNYRDIDNDRLAGKNTLMVRAGLRTGGFLYLAAGIAASLISSAVSACHGYTLAAALPLAYLPLHIYAYRSMVKIGKGRELNAVLGITSRNILVFGLLSAAGLLF